MKTKQPKRMLVIDIGSASVGAASVYNKDNMPVIEKVSRVQFGAGSEETRNQLDAQMQASLSELMKKYTGNYEGVHVVLAAPWHDAHIRTINSNTDKPETISEKSIERVIEQYKNEAPPQAGNTDVEAVAVQVHVGGYSTTLVQPVTGKQTQINLYESEMSTSLRQKIVNIVAEEVHGARIAFHTFPLVSGATLRSLMMETSFIFLDIGGEVTEVGVMHADGIHFLGSIPVGYWTMVRNMGGSGVGDTRSKLTLLAKNELSAEESATVSERFKNAFTPWLSELEDMLKEVGATVPTPRTLYILSDAEPQAWFKKGVDDYGTLSLTPTLITNATVQRFVTLGEDGAFDPFLVLEALFFHMSQSEIVGEPELEKMVYSK